MNFILATTNDLFIQRTEEASTILKGQLVTVGHLSEFFTQLFFKNYDLGIVDPKTPSSFPYLEIIERLRKEGIQLPLFLIDHELNAQQRILSLRKGIDLFLPQNFIPEELAEHALSLVRKKNVIEELHILKIGSLTIDIKNFRVWKGNKEIKLTQKEFSLLMLLATRKNNILSAEEIFNQLWGDYSKVSSINNVIQVHMSGLRKKLEENSLKNLITTVRGKGWIILDQKKAS
ncbi:response regulator transcription factor [Candidatus Methylacidiphilum infernorum]|uniref:DNA-binding response regulator, OmpR family (REC-wHTH domains) n=1 Tax=Methylacidiphilum infernorum (isolate V4) TaxID=481448 RepID=B3DZX6_METI4|nr:response regulator transcription factor [Candidatus Methylacidiphilum infernorum]ACD82637.1 DNA-binding response regulator, OmpR family (REC-wHTH domains) [Methylacidiphilum infernorum V4]